MKRTPVLVTAALLAAALSACGGGEQVSETVAAAPSTAPAAAPPKATPPKAAPATRSTVVLDPEGLGLASGSSTRRLTFAEASASSVEEALRRALGPGRSSAQPDCGAGLSAAAYPGVQLLLRVERFLGWSTQATDLRTADGLGVGTTLAELREARSDVAVRESTVGTRWTAGGMSGLLDDRDRVTLIAAGQTCSLD